MSGSLVQSVWGISLGQSRWGISLGQSRSGISLGQSRSGISLVGLLVLLVGCSGGLEAGQLGAPARVEGRVLDESGVPMPGVQVTLHRRRDAIARVETGPDGRFMLEGLFEGTLSMVAYAGQERGRLLKVDTIPAVTIDVGDVSLDRLRLQPEVLELRGVGYEERVDELPGDITIVTQVSDDRWFVLSVEGFGSGFTIHPISLSLSSGAPEIRMGASFEGSAYISEASSLGGDNVLVVGADASGAWAYWWLKEGGASRRLENPLERLAGARITDGHLDILWYQNDRLAHQRYAPDGTLIETVYLDFEGLAIVAYPASFDRRRDRVVLLAAVDDTLWSYDLADQTLVPTGFTGPVSWVYGTPYGSLIASLDSLGATEVSLVRIDTTGAETVAMYPRNCEFGSCIWHAGFSEDRLFYRVEGLPGLFSVNVTDGRISTPAFLQSEHSQLSACRTIFGESDTCFVHFVSEGRARVEIWTTIPGNEKAWAVDVTDDGQVRSLEVDFQGFLRRSLHASAQRQWDAYVNVTVNGHAQVFTAPLGAPADAFSPVTFVPRDHSFVGFGPAEEWVYSLVRDPLTSRQQLFRAPVEAR